MTFPPWHEVYSKSLLGAYGYPLSSPQLNTELRESYQLEGLKIGDVGILSPNSGSFDVLFNITLPRNEQPYPDRVGEDFMPITLIPQRDLNTRRGAVSPTQCVFPRGSIQVQSVRVHDRNQEPSRADYEFNLSTGDGAVLVLPEGADKCDLENENIFLDAAVRHGADWYECATDPNKAGRLINNNSLYLITGFHKARSWSLGATAQSGSGLQNQRSLKFEVGETRQDGVTARAYCWEIVQGFMGCAGPEYPYEIPRYITNDRRHGVNQTVFIRGFWITINNFLIFKTVSVKTPERTYGGLGGYVKNLMWGGPSESTSSSDGGDVTDNEVNQDFQGSHSRLYADTRMTIDRVPDAFQTFHPGDFINRYMLKKEPRATVAVTHDSLWIEILQTGLVELADFSQQNRLEEVLSNYHILVKDHAVYLQRGLPHERFESISCSNALIDMTPIPKQLKPGQDCSKQFEITNIRPIYSVSFIKDGTEIFGGGAEGILRRWRVDDGCEVGPAIRAGGSKILSAMLSPDHKWLVCGLRRLESSDQKAEVGVWDTQTHRKILDIHGHTNSVFSVDFSPDSTKVATGSADMFAFIWSMVGGQALVELRHDGVVVAVRFSPTGDRIATATAKSRQDTHPKSIRVYDSNNGDRLLDIPFLINTHVSSPLAWSTDGCQLFIATYSEVKCFDASSGLLVSQWSVPGDGPSASIVLARNQKFIAVVANESLSFWDAVTHKQIGAVIKHASTVWSVMLSPDDHHIATGQENGTIISRCLLDIIPGSYMLVNDTLPIALLVIFQLPLLYVNHAAFKSWAQGDLTRAEDLLTEEIAYPCHRARALAQRALVRTRLKKLEVAIEDAKESIKVQQSVIGHIANAMAHAGNGEHDLVMPAFDLVSSIHIPTENNFLLLMKAIILFESGKHDEAILRVDNLINIVDDGDRSPYTAVRARMSLVRGKASFTKGDIEGALEFLQDAIPVQNNPRLVVIKLIFGWEFDKLDQTIQLRLQDCIKPFEAKGDAEMESKNLEEAISLYSVALSLNPSSPSGILAKRSEARGMLGLWEDALWDADKAIRADPMSPCGYKRRHAALHGLRRYDDAIAAFQSMVSLIKESPNQDIRKLGDNYMSLYQLETAVERIARGIFRRCPLVLIDVESGCLCDWSEQLKTFKMDSQFKELISSMTEGLDDRRIHEVVEKYFRYVMFSHVWAGKEPSFQDVNSTQLKSVWQLDSSPLNEKLKQFCKVVQKEKCRWAWSDTCCIDKTNNVVMNQSLTMMYKWYEKSAATFVLLADVDSPSALGNLKKSKWMTRSWTAQELLAPRVLRFYDRNWRPYLDDIHSNHKESPVIIQELTDTLDVAPKTITTFHPDDLTIREKLRLASNRSAMVEEDVAYSLIGIFESNIFPRYGEGDAALAHLLQEIVIRSGDVTVLDWVGKSSSYNSCLPASLRAYSQPPGAPPAVEKTEMDLRIATLRNSLPQDEVVPMYGKIMRLPFARFANCRLHLPCIIFAVVSLKRILKQGRYRARVSGLGNVDFVTSDRLALSEAHKLVFVHPWIRDLYDVFTWDSTTDGDEFESDSETGLEAASVLDSSSHAVPAVTMGRYTRALRLVARLQQSFHALLLQEQSGGKFKRIATEQEIVVPGLEQQTLNFTRDIRIEVVEIL